MTLHRKPIPVNEAVGKVLDNTGVTDTEVISYEEAHGRILAGDLVATHDVPLFTKSAMDGFAIRAADSKGASGDNRIPFKVIEEVPANRKSTRLNSSHVAISYAVFCLKKKKRIRVSAEHVK